MSGVKFPPRKKKKLSDPCDKVEQPLTYYDIVRMFNNLPMDEKKKFNSAHFLGYENDLLELEQREVMSAWQFDSVTGEMFPIDPKKPWSRYVPPQLPKQSKFRNFKGQHHEKLSEYWEEFKNKMEEDIETFKILIVNPFKRRSIEDFLDRFYDRIYGYDMKLIEATDKKIEGKAGTREVTIRKLDKKLMDYPEGPVRPLTVIDAGGKQKQSNGDSRKRLNENALYGWIGPGTFPCRKTDCGICTNMSREATVNYGGDSSIVSTKRFTCESRDVLYALHCAVCTDNSVYAIHVGFTSMTLRKRISHHFKADRSNRRKTLKPTPAKTTKKTPTKTSKKARAKVPNKKNIGNIPKTVPATREEAEEIIRTGIDPENKRQDSHFHFAFEHPEGRSAGKVTVIKKLNSEEMKDKARLENDAKNKFCSYIYFGNGQGGLNSYGAA